MKPFDDLIAFVLDGKSSSILLEIEGACPPQSEPRPRFFVILLLDWLRNSTNPNIRHTLKPNRELWIPPLRAIVENVAALKQFFFLDEGSVSFRPEINDDEIRSIRVFVSENYKPQLFHG